MMKAPIEIDFQAFADSLHAVSEALQEWNNFFRRKYRLPRKQKKALMKAAAAEIEKLADLDNTP